MKALSLAFLAALVAIFAAELTGAPAPEPTSSAGVPAPAAWGHPWLLVLALVCCLAYLVASISSIRKISNRRRFDPTLALKYTDVFFKDNLEERRVATEALIEFHAGTKQWKDFQRRYDVDPVLDILDDIGFLLQGDQMSDWVVYQYFSYWIQLYYEAAEGYVKLRRDKDDSIWEHLPDLYADMRKIAAWKNKTTESRVVFNDEELMEYLRAEISLMPSAPSKTGRRAQ